MAAHFSHPACHLPLRCVASHVRVEHCTVLEEFCNKKNEYYFKSGMYSTFSNSTIVNKNKQVNHSKQETISVIFTHPSPNPSAPQNIV